jgi:hypothetical protein
MSPPHRDELLKQLLLRAAVAPPSLFLGATGLLLLAGPAALPYGALALLADAAWIWTRVRDPRVVQAYHEERLILEWRALMSRLETLTRTLDPATGAALSGLIEAHERLLAMYRADHALLPHTRRELLSLLRHCVTLAERRQQLQNYLVTFQSQDVQREAHQLQARMDGCRDAVSRQLYEQALEQKHQELQNFVRMEEALSRIDGQLAAVRCTFDNVLSKVVRMQAAGVEGGEAGSDPVFDELDRLSRGVEALELSLGEILTVRGGR